jgi:hypothetical protein
MRQCSLFLPFPFVSFPLPMSPRYERLTCAHCYSGYPPLHQMNETVCSQVHSLSSDRSRNRCRRSQTVLCVWRMCTQNAVLTCTCIQFINQPRSYGHTSRAPPGVSLPSGSRTRTLQILDPAYNHYATRGMCARSIQGWHAACACSMWCMCTQPHA